MTDQSKSSGSLLFWRCPARCGRAIRWDKTVQPPIARCGCGHTSEGEQAKTERALAALDAMAALWAAGFDIRTGVRAMMSKPDGEDRLIAFIKQAYCEGLYAGRMSHQDHPAPSQQHPGGT